ncbi:hypothetical protein JW960_27300 [candidate division KSB1 bacterium]|nr:hypothetical protein [candidate division KSB1 bacterium]
MKIKLFILVLCVFLFSLTSKTALVQEKQIENESAVTGKMRGQQKAQQHDTSGSQKIGEAVETKYSKMIDQMDQMSVQGTLGEQVGIDAMMGTTQGLKATADQLKIMSMHISKMMTNNDIMSDKVCAKKMVAMQSKLNQTNTNLDQLTELTQELMTAMEKQPSRK